MVLTLQNPENLKTYLKKVQVLDESRFQRVGFQIPNVLTPIPQCTKFKIRTFEYFLTIQNPSLFGFQVSTVSN